MHAWSVKQHNPCVCQTMECWPTDDLWPRDHGMIHNKVFIYQMIYATMGTMTAPYVQIIQK